jgi:hypothetical protein
VPAAVPDFIEFADAVRVTVMQDNAANAFSGAVRLFDGAVNCSLTDFVSNGYDPNGKIINAGTRTVVQTANPFVCFVAGTQVVVGIAEDGSYITKSIEDVEEGDVVLARDQNSAGDDLDQRPMVRLFRKTADHLRIVRIRDRDGNIETIQTTDEHVKAACKAYVRIATRSADLGANVAQRHDLDPQAYLMGGCRHLRRSSADNRRAASRSDREGSASVRLSSSARPGSAPAGSSPAVAMRRCCGARRSERSSARGRVPACTPMPAASTARPNRREGNTRGSRRLSPPVR